MDRVCRAAFTLANASRKNIFSVNSIQHHRNARSSSSVTASIINAFGGLAAAFSLMEDSNLFSICSARPIALRSSPSSVRVFILFASTNSLCKYLCLFKRKELLFLISVTSFHRPIMIILACVLRLSERLLLFCLLVYERYSRWLFELCFTLMGNEI